MLNDSQKEAVLFGRGQAMVLACPGSGKTMVIAHRARELAKICSPEKILVITFTRAAAAHMKKRFLHLTNGGCESPVFGTFHSIFFAMLKKSRGYSAAQIVAGSKRAAIVRDIIRRGKDGSFEGGEDISRVLSEISRIKCGGLSEGAYLKQNAAGEKFLRISQSYRRQLKEERLIDFDDILLLCRDMLNNDHGIRDYWRGRFEYVLIDEFQDINDIQYQTIRQIAAPQDNLFVVGDDDQSIYSFRGAGPEIMINFPKDYPNTRIIRLDKNYRSSPQIARAASDVIVKNRARFPKSMVSAAKDGPEVTRLSFEDDRLQHEYIAKDILSKAEKGLPLSHMAVLSRTNVGIAAVAETFSKFDIPFYLRENIPNIYNHWVAQDVLTYMIIAAGSTRRADFVRIINRPERYVKRDAFTTPEVRMQELVRGCVQNRQAVRSLEKFERDIGFIGGLAPYAAVNYIRHGIGYESYVRTYAQMSGIRADALIGVLDALQKASAVFEGTDAWIGHIKDYSARLSLAPKGGGRGQAVLLSTVHGAKGLEFDTVYMTDAIEGVFPHGGAETPEQMEEERRIFYVGMTRAGRSLNILYPKKHYNKDTRPSRFISVVEDSRERVLKSGMPADGRAQKAKERLWTE